MSETPEWFDESMRNGILIVGIYFRTLKGNVQNDARRWLRDTLTRELREYVDEINPLEYALTRYISPTQVKGKAGKAKGGEYKYLIKNATHEFYRKLFEILEERKKSRTPEWFGDYYVLVSRRLVKEVILNEK